MPQRCTPRGAKSAVSTLTINWSTVLRVSLFEFFMFFWLLKLLIWLRDAFGMRSADEFFCLYCKVTTFADGNHTLACFSDKITLKSAEELKMNYLWVFHLNRGNDLATVLNSAICIRLLPNNSFRLQKYKKIMNLRILLNKKYQTE